MSGIGQAYTSLSVGSDAKPREDLCREYFLAGYTNLEICVILETRHGISLSQRHLRRLLTGMGLKRRNNTDMQKTYNAIKAELQGSGSNLGYRAMKKKLLSYYGISAPRDQVAEIQRSLDPEGVEARQNHRLRRRKYWNRGPNFLIHIDGYDKLKRFGFAIHGAIDGFSRRVLWLRVGRTNNKPEVVADYFMDYMKEIQGGPRCIRVDAGTENTLIEDIQNAFREQYATEPSSCPSVIIGSSPRNQRIERYWRTSRESGCQFWMDFMRDLESTGIFDLRNSLHLECIRFSFMELLQADLDTQRANWNQHCIRECSYGETLGGKPDLLFFSPNLYACRDFKYDATLEEIQDVRQTFCHHDAHPTGCDLNFALYVQDMMKTHRKSKPTSQEEAVNLLTWLLNRF